MAKRLILCNCSGSQSIEPKVFEGRENLRCSRVHSELCGRELDIAAKEISSGEAIIACQQEAQKFRELAEELSVAPPEFVDIRDRAGWTESPEPGPKMAALVAEAQVAQPPVKTFDISSEGQCLIFGRSDVAIAAAERLSDALAVTLLLDPGEELPLDRRFETLRGRLKTVTGAFGQFDVALDAVELLNPAGRGGFATTAPRDAAKTRCDIILDLSGNAPLFPAPEKRDGYLRADPGSQKAVADAVFEAAQLIGTFEKTLFLTLEQHLCAHSRAGQTGCSNCLDICPTGAILPAGDHVDIDPLVCAGCGACSSLCPSGAIKYDAPPVATVNTRVRTLAETFLKAGGENPVLLVHDDSHGAEMIALSARFGRGLPGNVLPLSVGALTGFGHAEMLAALASGFCAVHILAAPRTERDPIRREIALAQAMGGATRLFLLDVDTPDAMSDALYDAETTPQQVEPVLLMGDRRQVARMAAKSLLGPQDAPVPLPENAPYGAVLVYTDACTLCLSCVSLCPSGALVDNPDKPELRFQEDACLQCGLCANICPEKAISLQPRFDPSDDVMKLQTLNEEEPFCCIECGAPFGVKSTVEKIVEKLAGKHSMFADSDTGRLIQMCDDCRVKAQYHSTDNPFASADRPKVRTTDDYFSKRRDH
ncbi:4Fe-4S binding protein [Thalassovita aquimarina]|uniref:4Fe-4S binding protein n=1 Tax=Thalassovita aquimarina TaxID=2785917 RepID=UPI0035667100